jgi:hypothetical protein
VTPEPIPLYLLSLPTLELIDRAELAAEDARRLASETATLRRWLQEMRKERLARMWEGYCPASNPP